MADLCANCGHAISRHTDWWDATDIGGGAGVGCRDCQCDDFYRPGDRLPPPMVEDGFLYPLPGDIDVEVPR